MVLLLLQSATTLRTRRGLTSFCKVDHSRISISFLRNSLGLNNLCERLQKNFTPKKKHFTPNWWHFWASPIFYNFFYLLVSNKLKLKIILTQISFCPVFRTFTNFVFHFVQKDLLYLNISFFLKFLNTSLRNKTCCESGCEKRLS